MRKLSMILILAAANFHLAPAALAAGPAADGFVTRSGSKLMLNGKEYRAIGVNQPDLFTSYIGSNVHTHATFGTPEKARENTIRAVLEAENNGIAFIRFWASGVWPVEQKLYFDNPAQYWAKMDEVFKLCRDHHVKLVPSIFFSGGLWPSLCNEPRQSVLDPHSKTFQAMHKYAREILSRYKDDPNVLQWEIGNEYMHTVDLPVRDRRVDEKKVKFTGIKPIQVPEDSMTFEMMRRFYIEMSTFMKSCDPHHLVASGDAGPRMESWELRATYPKIRWRKDTLREYLADLLGSQPDPLDAISIHYYGSLTETNPRYSLDGLTPLIQFRCIVRAIHAANTPVYIGEFGNSKPSLAEDQESRHPLAALEVVEQENVSLTCIWVWYFPRQPENNLRADTHPALLKRVKEYNQKYAGLP